MPSERNDLEALESRTLLSSGASRLASVKLDHSDLIIFGALNVSNVITVRYTKDGDNVLATVNGKNYVFDNNDVDKVIVFGGNVNDDIETQSVTDHNWDKDTTIRGGSGDDKLIGSTERDLITGDNGNDTIYGGPQDDNINGLDTIYGGNGNDHITVDADTALVFGGRGDDLIDGATRHGYIWGNDGNDTITMPGDHLIILGNAGNDTLTGESHSTLYGGGQNDVLAGSAKKVFGEIKDVDSVSSALQVRIPTPENPT